MDGPALTAHIPADLASLPPASEDTPPPPADDGPPCVRLVMMRRGRGGCARGSPSHLVRWAGGRAAQPVVAGWRPGPVWWRVQAVGAWILCAVRAWSSRTATVAATRAAASALGVDPPRRGVLETVRSDVARGKALEFLIDHATVVDEGETRHGTTAIRAWQGSLPVLALHSRNCM